jgi:hypothetical protein
MKSDALGKFYARVGEQQRDKDDEYILCSKPAKDT